MSNVVLRQNDLFLGEDWQVIYAAFNDINFKNYSFTTIKSSLYEYIRQNYPEDYTDWSNSAEFSMIIDTLAYVGETLSYRIDLNARDNFIDTAERRESIIRLAKMINYSPKRNFPARGKVKIRSIKTSQMVVDSEGRSLQNVIINWNDPQNPDWYEQFILVINATLLSSNPFGKPIKNIKTNDGNMQLYRMNSIVRSDITSSFTATVAGEAMNFEIVNPDFDEFGNIYERHPNPDDAKNILYLNDGSGNASPHTGFFLYFKQGSLDFENYNFDAPIENREVDIDVANVNEMDVWVQKINENGVAIKDWEKVPTIENIVYNSIDREIRDIFAVNTKNNDTVSIRFSDGRFGTVPKGLFRIWYRVSNGLEYTIHPVEMKGRNVVFSYRNNSGIDRDSMYDISIIFDLFDTVRNSFPREEADDIKRRAPRVYYSQNRMTNGEDYNAYPLSYGPQIKKLKAVNRVYSGQSPFFDNYDPTQMYSSTIEFGDDGILYKEDYTKYSTESLPTNLNPTEIISNNILPLLYDTDLNTFFLDRYKPVNVPPFQTTTEQGGFFWNKVSGQTSVSTGFLSTTLNGSSILISPSEISPRNIISERSYLLFEEPIPMVEGVLDTDFVPKRIWASVLELNYQGIYDPSYVTGPIVLDQLVPDDWRVKQVIPAFKQLFNADEIAAIESQIENNNTFGIRYDTLTNTWKIVDELNVAPETSVFSTQYAGDTTDQNRDASWFIRAQYMSSEYKFVARFMRYVFESANVSRFFFSEEVPGVNQNTNRVARSIVTILGLNKNLSNNQLLDIDTEFQINKNIRYSDGYIEPRRIQVVPNDNDYDNTRDNPVAFDFITNSSGAISPSNYVFFVRNLDELGFDTFVPTLKIFAANTAAQLQTYDWVENVNQYIAGWAMNTQLFYEWNETSENLAPVMDRMKYRYYIGRAKLNYKHQHFSPQNNRIDPAITNVIDMYVLTEAYHKTVTDWKSGPRLTSFPQPELSIVLQDTYSGLDEFKSISDQMIWNPSKFTLLFGPEALPENQAIFKVVKVESTGWTDNQIKQGVLDAIEEYFNLDNWTYGESIYTSELIAYIHMKMISHVASVVIVPKQKNEFGINHPGDVYQIRLDFNALPFNVATVDNIIMIPSASKYNVVM